MALNGCEWPKVAPSKTPCCTDKYSSLWMYSTLSRINELLNGTEPESWKSSKSISHVDLWMIWIQVPSPPPALQQKSLEQYMIWTTAPQWSVEPDDGWAGLSPQTNWCWPLIPYSHLFPGYEFRSCWQTNMPHWHCKHIGDWRAVQSVHLREGWGHVLSGLLLCVGTWCVILALHILHHFTVKM